MYQLTFDRNDWYKYQIDGNHQWSLPPVACDSCGSTWKTTGEAYPTFDISRVNAIQRDVTGSPVSPEKFQRLRHVVLSAVPASAPVEPGTDLGAFIGSAKGRFLDFNWSQRWTVFLQFDVVTRLLNSGVELPRMAFVKLHPARNSDAPRLLEPEAIPLVDFAREGLKDPHAKSCERCGRLASGFRELLIGSDSALPEGVDMCRGRNNPAILLVSERFAGAVRDLDLTGCILKELPRA